MTSAALTLTLACLSAPASPPPRTYCNPLNLDYAYCPIPDFVRQGKHRTSADPVIVTFRGDYYLFATNQWGYWWSEDMARWNFVPRKFLKAHHKVYDELCAPAAFVMDDALYLLGSTYTDDFPLYKSTNPKAGEWTEAVAGFNGGEAGAWDPAFFLDDDGRLCLYHGSSNAKPLLGRQVDRRTLQPDPEPRALIRLADDQHGWERFGEANDNTFLRPFLEGAWMTKHAGRYYLQYSAPGTEFGGYADGVYVGDAPLGPFEYQAHNPFSYKPGGFARGAGHGATFQDPSGRWWHTATIAVCVKNNFERRIGIWPAGFDEDGVLSCDTAYGDYPHLLPHALEQKPSECKPWDDASNPVPLSLGRGERGEGGDPATVSPSHHVHTPATSAPGEEGSDDPRSAFAGWMLLNYAKPVRASSTLGGFSPNFAVDEDIRTYWSAATAEAGEWFETDLGAVSTVRAVQVNYADQDAELMGKVPGLCHRYRLLASTDGEHWQTIADKSKNTSDVPHDYVELPEPVEARFVRIENVHVPTGRFALSGLRVFGKGHGARPGPVADFVTLRGDPERRNAWLKWQASPDATGYVIRAGVSPDKLYTSVMVYAANEYYFRAMDKTRPYYFTIEAFNENGIGDRSPVVKAE